MKAIFVNIDALRGAFDGLWRVLIDHTYWRQVQKAIQNGSRPTRKFSFRLTELVEAKVASTTKTVR